MRTVLIGGGGHARVVADVARRAACHALVGYTAKAAGRAGALPWLGTDAVLDELAATGRIEAALLGIGIIDASTGRQALDERLRVLGLVLPPLVAPTALVAEDVTVEEGAVVLDGAIVNPASRVGRCSIVNTRAVVEHDCILGAYSHLAPGAILCGGVIVGERVMIGAQACVIPGRRIAAGCVVGAGAVVTTDLTEPGCYVGIPARRVPPSKADAPHATRGSW